jgi:cbb3-type cytochrome oxidase subunit 1
MISKKSTISLVLGCLGVFGWLLPVLGIVMAVVGLVSGIHGYKEDLSRRAKAGIALNIIFLVVAIVWLTVVVVMRFRNQWFFY